MTLTLVLVMLRSLLRPRMASWSAAPSSLRDVERLSNVGDMFVCMCAVSASQCGTVEEKQLAAYKSRAGDQQRGQGRKRLLIES